MNEISEVLEINVKITQKDYLIFNKMLNSKFLKRIYFLAICFVLVICALIAYNPYSIKYDRVIQIIIVIIMVIGLINYVIVKGSKKRYENDNFIREDKHYTLSKSKVAGNADSGNFNVTWDKIDRVQEKNGVIAIFISKSQGFIIPIACIDNGELELLKNLIRNNVSLNKIKMK